MNTNEAIANHLGRTCIIACLACFLQSCVDHHIGPPLPVSGDYFPMSEGSWWEYVTKYPCSWPDTADVCYDSSTYTSGGDSWGNVEAYQPLSTVYGTFRWIRKEGDAYHAMGAYVPEYKFLDTSLPLNGSWVVGDQLGREEFTIMEVSTVKTILDVTYENVIVVRHRIIWQYENQPPEVVRTSHHYYAKDIGEIYLYHAANPDRDLPEIEVFLTRFEIR